MKRRALLSTVAGSALGLAAGCLSDLDEPVETPVNPQTTMATTDPPTETNTSEPDSSIGLSVVNEDDKSHTLSVRVTGGDETRFVGSLDIGAGPGRGRSVENDLVGERTVRVVAELEAGATLDYEWTVTDETRHLELVVTSDADLEPRQRVRPALDAADLPYTVTGAKDIFAPPSATIRNRSDADARLTVAIDHDGSRVFERAFDAATDREISTPALVASHGTYEVSWRPKTAAPRPTSGTSRRSGAGRRSRCSSRQTARFGSGLAGPRRPRFTSKTRARRSAT
ncbi:uncharacterized protein HVO_2799 [Haloferax volcanii DS2]|uniref:Lipoprotein n=1 Tax=Haloferax volcanii (strain ATCC 29605 / DSM 3757 / JCM 8879 / NBRC 14742 / NCIMB 2012 / VKM B-1768 / DS2) TaxID=309800 RepID=D4GX22_HALVD|nr:hypothetical protein [Haloferax volcanii]ADE04988.1 uncharacterized protein HVO_2799 [Haloferax volcanii DS2]MDW7537925.1 hypothetical protein [Haloferax volcanii]